MLRLLEKRVTLYRGIPGPLLGRLLAAPFVLSLVDLTVTLLFQPAEYWQGDRSAVIEGNPIARWAFSIHPLMIMPGLTGWYVIVIPLILKSPAWLGLRVHVFLVLGHLVMISGWLIRNHETGTLFAVIVWLCALQPAWMLVEPYLKHWNSKVPIAV
ncbi:hypothetical protein N9C66_05605 [Akkermansiaceae bacterium]|nr:hypothetical protein [Akkermansiaceae bacterium]MDB4541920.1 hypothetical protein [bacterium]MDA7892069.1 hypothetical protein [Akkermansiaceae bacterium]MDA9830798.1 hypothetical protein [Akkermansiaceae bacterium]MDB4465265.1 hypothetical protein [Akkermansiaceae bacterium]